MTRPASPRQLLKEYFSLSHSSRLGQRLSSEDRSALVQELEESRQRREASDALWSLGHRAEGLRLAIGAFDDTLRLASRLGASLTSAASTPADDSAAADAEASGPSSVEVGWAATARVLRFPDARIAQLGQLDSQIDRASLPELDDEVEAAHAEVYRSVLDATSRFHNSITPVTMTRPQRRRTVTTRAVMSFCALGFAVVALYALLRPPHEARATASAVYGDRPEFQPSALVDEDESSEWVLPDRTAGWAEIRLTPPRDLQEVRLRNGNNRDIRDRATKDYTLELYAGEELLLSRGGQFGALEAEPGWSHITVNQDGVDRIRFEVRTWHGRGAALAEIGWEE